MKYSFIRGFKAQGLTLVIGAAFLSFSALANAAEVQIFSNEQRQENSNSLILDNDNTGGNVSLQFGSSLNEQVYWDNTGGQFVFTDDANVQGNLDVDGTITAGSGDIQLTDATGLINGDNIANGTIDDDSIDFGMGADQVGADDIAVTDTLNNSSATNVQGVVGDLDTAISNTQASLGSSTGTTNNSYILDSDNSGGNVTLQFGTTLNETMYWNNAASRFEISDDVNVDGNITLTGTVDGVDVGGLGSTVTTLGSTVSTIDSTVSGLGTSVSTLNSNVSTLNSDVSNINSTVSTHGTDIGALNTTVGNLGTTVTGIGSNVSTLNTTVSTHGTDIGTLNTTVGTLGTDLTTLGSRVDTHDTDIANINTTLAGNTVQSIPVAMNDLTVGADGSSNLADVYSDFDAANKHQYYIVKTQQSGLQDVDLKFKVKLPEDFKDFSNANDLSFFYKNTGANNTESKAEILVQDDEGDNAFSAPTLYNASWTDYADELDGAQFNPVAGEYVYVTVKGYAKSGAKSPYIGEIVLNYNSKDVWSAN